MHTYMDMDMYMYMSMSMCMCMCVYVYVCIYMHNVLYTIHSTMMYLYNDYIKS